MTQGATIQARLLAVLGRPGALLALADHLTENGAVIAAARHIAAAARAGSAQAQGRLGLCYLGGKGVPASAGEACHWLGLAARNGDVTARTALASLALRGINGPQERGLFSEAGPTAPDHHAAAVFARQGAEAGSAEAQALLAYILRADPSLARTPDEADQLYRASAEAGWPLGQLGHAKTLLGAGTPEALREALALAREAAKAGLPTARFLLGMVLEAGACGPPDLEEALRQYRAGAEQGHSGAKTRLGLALLAGRGTDKNLVEGETWLRRAALDGDAIAAAVLGDFHASPDQPLPNPGEAARWYRRAAELGHAGSAHALARAITAGAEGRPDPLEIALWLQAAIEGGVAGAWPDLGGLIAARCLPGTALPMLLGWLRERARRDQPEAVYYLGFCANGGIGMPPDAALARRHYLWAAGLGFVEAMAAAAEMLVNGRGGVPEPTLAHALFHYAARRDHPGAVYALGIMAGAGHDSAMAYFRRAAALGHARAQTLIAEAPIAA